MLQDFKKFALRGNVVDMAIGFTVGAAFATIARSFVDDVVMPPIALITGRVDFLDRFWLLRAGPNAPPPYETLAEAKEAGAVTINYGAFLNTIVTFVIIAFVVFLIVRAINRAEKELEERFGEETPEPGEPDTKKCPYCLTSIPYRAVKCAACTSEVPRAGQEASAAARG